MRRTNGTGSMFRRGDGLWVGVRELSPGPDHKRRNRRVTSATYCGMLKKFSAIDMPARVRRDMLPRPVSARSQYLAAARDLGTHTPSEWCAKVCAQRGCCYYCGQVRYEDQPLFLCGDWKRIPIALVKDHMIPISRGGSDSIDNLVGACAPCNCAKGTKTADEYFAQLRWPEQRVALATAVIREHVHRRRDLDYEQIARAVLEAVDNGRP